MVLSQLIDFHADRMDGSWPTTFQDSLTAGSTSVHLLIRDGWLDATQMLSQKMGPGHFWSPYSHVFLSTKHKQHWLLILSKIFFFLVWKTYATHKHLRPLTEVQFCVTDSIATEFEAKYRIWRMKGTSIRTSHNSSGKNTSTFIFKMFPTFSFIVSTWKAGGFHLGTLGRTL